MSDKVSKNREKKEKIVARLSEKLGRAKALVFTDYQGMTHKQLEDLKKALKAADADLVVAKNTLLKLALNQVRLGQNMEELQGPTATLFSYSDVIAPLKEIAKSIKLLKLPAIKFGILDDKLLAEADVLRLSTLPSREILIAQVIGGIKAPIYGLHRALNWNLQKLVLTLKAIEKNKT